MVEAIKIFLSILLAVLTVGGSFYIFTIDRLKYYEKKLKIQRIIVGSVMIISGITLGYAYQENSIELWQFTEQHFGWEANPKSSNK